jgi:glucose-6-phosphate 1-dehydrogenase
MTGQPVELVAHSGSQKTMTEYERLLGDAIDGDGELFATESSVESEWQVVDGLLRAATPVKIYEPGSWGPAEADALLTGYGPWRNPAAGPGRSP